MAENRKDILPQPDAGLNYTQIMFEHPQINGAGEYLLQVTVDEKGSSFRHPLFSQKDSSTAVMLSNFEFGKGYVWRYTGLNNGKELGWQGPYHFKILKDEHVDTNTFRVRVLLNDSSQSTQGLIIMGKVMVDRKGNFVWYLPVDSNAQARLEQDLPSGLWDLIADLRLTPAGTMTFLNGAEDEETDLQGHILWQAPKRSTAGMVGPASTRPYDYHHCFKRLATGNYMVLDRELISGPTPVANVGGNLPPANNNGAVSLPRTIPINQDFLVGSDVIREFDKNDSLVWSWSSKGYFDNTELVQMAHSKPDPGMLYPIPGAHMNAFDIDEGNGFVYAGFRNVSRIIKIDKKSGKVLCAWGDNMTWSGAPNGSRFFSKQHGITLLRDGSVAVFNNGSGNIDDKALTPPGSVVIFSQPTGKMNSQLIWVFDCKFDSADINHRFVRGGTIDELKNGNLLVGMGTNRAFEVTRGKRISWSSEIEKHREADSVWVPYAVYGVHYTSSLYPCYFTIQSKTEGLIRGSGSFQLKVFNNGTEDDSYQINVSSKSGYYDRHFSTPVLLGGNSTSFEITPALMPEAKDDIKIVVTSQTNPGFSRVINIEKH